MPAPGPWPPAPPAPTATVSVVDVQTGKYADPKAAIGPECSAYPCMGNPMGLFTPVAIFGVVAQRCA
jgi:hypothetical protein